MFNRLQSFLMLVVVMLGFSLYSCSHVLTQEHNHPAIHAELHEQFYNKWQRPDIRDDEGKRTASCCNKQDCFPTPIRAVPGGYEALDRDKRTWVFFPPEKVEQEQTDPIESPDMMSHACINPYTQQALCATLGSGQ